MARTLFVGQAASPGVGIGQALVVADRDGGVTTSAVSATGAGPSAPRRTSESPGPSDDGDRLRAAADAAARELDELAADTMSVAGASTAAVMEAQALLARDPAVLRPALELVEAGWTAEAALIEATDRHAAALSALDDPTLKARAADVRDVGQRIARCLSGGQVAALWLPDGTPTVLIADDLLPSETALLRSERVAGLALAGGSLLGHTAIVARALELPLVLGLGPAILAVAPRARVLVDGSQGRVLIEPDTEGLPALRT